MDERRKAQRKETDQFFGVYHRETDEFIGRLVDMSTNGMKIHSVKPMDINFVYEFKIDLPKEVAGKRELFFEAECLRCYENKTQSENYELGFRITNIDFKELETIQYLLNDTLFHESDEKPRVTLAKKSE